MWILSILPNWAIHLVVIAGILGIIVGFVLTFIPQIAPYRLAIQVCSILILSLGVYLEGGLADYDAWQLKVKEVETKLAKAEAESQKQNVKIPISYYSASPESLMFVLTKWYESGESESKLQEYLNKYEPQK